MSTMSHIVTVTLTLIWSLLPLSLENFNLSVNNNTAAFKLVIDAGHGGRDSGCLGAPHNEKDIVLPIALELGRLIEEGMTDVDVIYTREEDKFIGLSERAKIANRAQADLFISIHANSLPTAKQVGGSETYVMGHSQAKQNLEIAKRENASILLEEDYEKKYDYDPNSDEGHILLSMMQNLQLEKSIAFAQLVENSIAKYAHGKSRGVKQAGFHVLRETTMPSVLLETGYLTNVKDNEYLQDHDGQMAIAFAVYEAFQIYKDNESQLGLASIGSGPAAEATVTSTPSNPKINKMEGAEKNNTEVKSKKAKVESLTRPDANASKINKSEVVETSTKYHIQLAASKVPVEDAAQRWSKFEGKIEQKKDGDYYKYLSPGYDSISEGKQMLQYFKRLGYSDAFIVAYKNDERVKIIY